ncbi:MAG TPA: hypothetical protein VHT03_07540 [Rhizomicrobium sp.]|jgi:hypothetical protein|nr:hypothetical protein [Rhizomicrobium sp.]
MTRIPVAETIRFAYTFAFGQIGAIIGLVWLPLIIVAFLQFLPYALGTAYTAATANTAEAAGATFINLAFSTTALVLYSMNFVSVTRQALGLRQGAASVHFSLGWPEWRMFVAIVICGLILTAAIGLYLILGSLFFAAQSGTALMAAVAAVYAVAGFCALVWFALRLLFVLPPLIVAEDRVDLVRAFLLTRGNAWRALAIALAVTVPLLILQCIALALIAGPGFFAPLPGTSAAALAQRFRELDAHMPALIGLALLLTPFNLGLTLGASSFAYRTLVPPRPPERS